MRTRRATLPQAGPAGIAYETTAQPGELLLRPPPLDWVIDRLRLNHDTAPEPTGWRALHRFLHVIPAPPLVAAPQVCDAATS